MKKEYNAMFDKLAPQKSDDELLQAVLSGKREGSMAKRKFRSKPLFIAAVIIIASLASILTVNAATQGAVVKFFMGGEKLEGSYDDYVDEKGFRHITFEAVLPIYEESYAIIYDIDAPRKDAVRVLIDDTDPEFMEKLRQYDKEAFKCSALPDSEDFGLVFKDSEVCLYNLRYTAPDGGFDFHNFLLGGKFMHTGAAEEHPSGVVIIENQNECTYDVENETQIVKRSIYYYVGKE